MGAAVQSWGLVLSEEQEEKRRLRLTEGGLGSQMGQPGSPRHPSTGQTSLGGLWSTPCSERAGQGQASPGGCACARAWEACRCMEVLPVPAFLFVRFRVCLFVF